MRADSLAVSTSPCGDDVVVAVVGELDMATAPQLRQVLIGLIDEGHHRLVLDLTGVTFCDSIGLGVMVGALKRIRGRYADGHLRIVCCGPVLRVLEVTALTRVFAVHTTLSDALGRTIPASG